MESRQVTTLRAVSKSGSIGSSGVGYHCRSDPSSSACWTARGCLLDRLGRSVTDRLPRQTTSPRIATSRPQESEQVGAGWMLTQNAFANKKKNYRKLM